MIMMNKNEKGYEPPKTKIYRFGDSDRILTESGTVQEPEAEFASNALNAFMGGTNTTIE